MKINSFLYLKAIFYLTTKQRLKWSVDRITVTTQITSEFQINICYYDNGTQPYVIDFDCIYTYYDIEHQLIKATLSERLRESNPDDKIFELKRLYDLAKFQAENNISEKLNIETYELLNEYAGIYMLQASNNNKQLSPFDDVLLLKILQRGSD